MKSRFALFLVTTLTTGLFAIPTVLATDVPTLDPIASPVHATKAIISGHTQPHYKIIITGGTYQIPPTYADETGAFEVQVALIAESTNLYSVKAVDENDVSSEQVQISIVEGAAAAAQAESQGGGDRTAPPSPQIQAVPTTIDAGTYLFEGTTESGALIMVTGTQGGTTRADTDGKWQIFLNLKQNSINNFTFTAKDDAGNISPGVKVTITEESLLTTADTTETDSQDPPTDSTETSIIVVALSDINDHWAKDYIIQLVSEGVVSGYEDGTFRPTNPVTRAEFIKMVDNAFGYDLSETPADLDFTDVKNEDWFFPYIETAHKSNLIQGYSDNTFRPGNTINRAEAMKILMNAAGVDTSETSSIKFPDVNDNDWFAPYVLKAREMEIVSGYNDGRFGPADVMTRGQVAKVIVELRAQL